MIDILFFAQLRERLETDKLHMPLPGHGTTVDALVQHLITTYQGLWPEVLGADNVIKAVNQQVVTGEHVLGEGDEVAFFPPVTGG